MITRLWLLAGLCALGCDGGINLGLAGCNGFEAAVFPRGDLNTVERGANVVLTAAGTEFLIAERERLAGLLLDVDPDGWVRLDLPPFETGDARFGVGLRALRVAFDLRAADIALDFVDDPARIRLRVNDARLRFESGEVWVGAGGNGACTLENGVDPGGPGAHFLIASLVVDLFPEVDQIGRFDLRVAVEAPTVDALDIGLGFDPDLPECSDFGFAFECELACGASDLGTDIVELLYDLFSEQLNALLTPLIEATVNDFIAALTDKPIAIEGAIGPALLADLLPIPRDAHKLLFRAAPSPEGFSLRTAGERGDGLGLTLDLGLDTIDHPCVPPTDRAPLLSAGPGPVMTGYDHQGMVYHLGLALPGATLDRALWTLWRSGLLCLAVDTDDIAALTGQRVDTAALGLFLPGLDRLAGGPRPMMIAIDPRFDAADFPLVRLVAVHDDGGVPQLGLDVTLPDIGVDLYAYIEDRWTRVFAARTDVQASVVIQATPDNRLALAVAPPAIGELAIEYDGLVGADDLPALLALVLDLATRTLLSEGLAFDVGIDGLIEQLTGLPYDARIAALRVDGAMADHLSVLLSLDRAGAQAALGGEAETVAQVAAVAPGRVELQVAAPGLRGARFQWQVDGGSWRPLRAAVDGVLTVEEPLLALPGLHRIAVRAVAEGAYATLDPSPALVEVVVPPKITATPGSATATPAPRTAAGCHAAPVGAGGWPLALLLPLALLARRRERR